ncbi:MAG: tetratricopeptide repeat protein [Saprospiraceae bacterium]|nr:tetratricopeptide repeat protein [Saprospiraceae bacterium]MBK7738566.1 tetratricopeptide repeat protein [Saprospiraceae bacterium]MBK7912862.1 tetratricopeptide repeat protein [Saprospiraceae bacterium]
MMHGTFYKVIIQGKFEFGTERSFQKVYQLFIQRSETLYKKEILFKTPETIFFPEDKSLNIGRFIGNSSEKVWKNTISLIEYCAQFSLSGSINAWMTDNGKILHYCHFEPLGDKTSVMLYQEGKKMAEQIGKEQEAIQLLTEAIEKHDRHSQAYEKRAYINFHLKNYDDAIYDFKKSIKYDFMNASSHYGLARSLMIKNDLEGAISALEEATKQSIALQPLYWASRRVKGNCHLELNQFDKAAFEYKLFITRNFPENDPNLKYLSKTWFNYGKSLFALGQVDAALDAFDKSLEKAELNQETNQAEVFMHRGMARKAAGKADYILDLQKAAELGSQSASLLLAEQA